jgi:6-pyruvoyltetrahydropterin/6-carboxytetrahydropterin synthase
MWILSKEFTFEAAHQLPHHDGKCQRLHGHSWKGTIYVEGESLIESGSKQGMILDYGDLKQAFKSLLDDRLDHCYLNESLGLENPTSEEIARLIYQELLPKLPNIVGVMINETCTSSCFYTERKSGFNLNSFAGILG